MFLAVRGRSLPAPAVSARPPYFFLIVDFYVNVRLYCHFNNIITNKLQNNYKMVHNYHNWKLFLNNLLKIIKYFVGNF